jgi:hypothetical protein
MRRLYHFVGDCCVAGCAVAFLLAGGWVLTAIMLFTESEDPLGPGSSRHDYSHR